MSLLLLGPTALVCLSHFLLFELSDAPLTLACPRDSESTPLQLKLNDLANAITTIGIISGGFLFVALLTRYFFELGTNILQRYSDVSSSLNKSELFHAARRVTWD